MQSTTNYSMNLVEGTDLVNIPVQLNPNFQTVDAEMFKNKQAGIGTATEVVTGTVHAVVRSNVDADVFRFTATGAWTSGDTMTLDGSAVTVHLADGTAPATGAYIIGAEVVAVVNGTLVTLLTSSGAIDPGVTSFNSRTGAVVPTASDYDASMVDYDNTLSGLTATDAQSAIDELAANVGGSYTLLWTNPDATVAFNSGAIVLSEDSSDYDFLLIDYKMSTTSSYRSTNTISTQANGIISLMDDVFYLRQINSISGNSMSFGNCLKYGTYGATPTTSNNNLIPYKVYGIKA